MDFYKQYQKKELDGEVVMGTDELQTDRINLFRHALVLSALLMLLGFITAQNTAPRQSPVLVNMGDIYYNL